jgi:hypothetical protein
MASDESDFRTERVKLPADLLALVVHAGATSEPVDLIDQPTWNGLTWLPDHVTLRTTDHHGASLKRAYEAWGYWVGLVLDIHGLVNEPQTDPLAVATLNAIDDFQASLQTALTGFYRQSIGVLRSVLESMLAAVYFKKLSGKQDELTQWLNGHEDGRFQVGRARKELVLIDPLRRFESAQDSLLGQGGWYPWLYGLLCAFVHGRPAHAEHGGTVLATTNSDMWQSNGPIYVPQAYDFWELNFFDAMLLSMLLAGLSDERLVNLERPQVTPFETFLEHLMEWHPSPGPPPTAAAVAGYLCPA